MSIRTLRAFAWLRWRVLMNAIERTGARDTLERFSLAVEQIGPIVAFGMLVPSAAALAGLGAYAGYWIAQGDQVVTFTAITLLLLVASGFSVLGPVVIPSLERTNAVRLLLLPISRRTLYLAQAAGALADPWIVLAIPMAIAVALGLAAAGAFTASVVALAGGVLIILLLCGLTALASFVLQLVVRDRRRGELLALVLVMVPLLGIVPAILQPGEGRRHGPDSDDEQSLRRQAWQVGGRVYRLLPSELYARTVRSAASGAPQRSLAPLAGLAVLALAAHALGLVTFGRLLDTPASSAPRRSRAGASGAPLRLPGLSRGAAAVASAQLRLALRTPRGRSIMLSTPLAFSALLFMFTRGGGGPASLLPALGNGPGFAAFGAWVALLALLPFAANQFAIDRAGLTRALLSPLATRELLVGKVAGNALILVPPMLAVALISLLAFRDGDVTIWLSVALASAATYLLIAPGTLVLSALFPRTVDLNSIGRSSNAHGAAGLLGFLLTSAAALPAAVLGAVALGIFGRPALLLGLMVVWAGVAFGISRALLPVVAGVFERRKENLGMI